MKTLDFSESIAASDLKVGRCGQLIELIKVSEIGRAWLFLYIGPRSFTYENQNQIFSDIPLGGEISVMLLSSACNLRVSQGSGTIAKTSMMEN